MKSLRRACVRFLADEGAQSPVEYTAMLAMIVLTIDLSVTSLGSYVTNPFWSASNAIAAQNNQIQNRGVSSTPTSGATGQSVTTGS